MKRSSWRSIAAAIACLGLLMPQSAYSTPHVAPTNDVALRPGGLLVGQVVDTQGVAKAGIIVSVRQGEHEVVQVRTDENGAFAAQGLRGGQYQIVTSEGACDCRLWAADTAPPAAKPAALVVYGDEVVRGQFGPVNSWVEWMKCHPYITAGTVAAAIAIPLAFIDSDKDSGS